MKRLSHSLLFFGIVWIVTGYGQSNDDYAKQQINKILPPSPNAAALGIFGNTPVGHYTGVPNISIPIYEIQTGDFTLPITLSYHASGIKVAQEASTVGLGWALNAGGCIVREKKHKDDFGYGGYFKDMSFPQWDENNNPADYLDSRYYQYLVNDMDSEPDIFRYNFGNMSGSFFLKKRSTTNDSEEPQAIITNKNNWLKIIIKEPQNHSPYEIGFEIRDPYGNTYHFGSCENTRMYCCTLTSPPKEEHVNRYHQIIEPTEGNDYEVTTAWFLDKIITAKKDTIQFEYEKERILSSVGVSEDVSYMYLMTEGNSGSTPVFKNAYKYYCLSYMSTDQLLLKKIFFNNGEITIDYADRKDIVSDDYRKQAKRVDWLTIKNKSNTSLSRIKFNYSYLENVVEDSSLGAEELIALNSRLVLDGIAIYRNGGDLDQKYIFSYNRNSLPIKNSKHTDHWGYYNEGAEPLPTQGYHYTPPIHFSYIDSDGVTRIQEWKGINKNSSAERSQHGILTSIRYPTGGRAEFEYELNDFSNGFRDSADSLITLGGGLRIRKICDLSAAADTISLRHFIYKENGKSTGILMTVPVYHYFFNLADYDYSGNYVNGASNSFKPVMGSASGMYVGYSYVEERNITQGVNNGYTAYRFRNNADQIVGLGEQIIRNYPSIPQLDNGLPLQIAYFDRHNNLVKKTDFNYTQTEQSSIKGLMCYLPPMASDPFFVKFYDLYSERWELKGKIETQYFPDNRSISIRTGYEFNQQNYLVNKESIRIIDPDEEEYFVTETKYPTDYGDTLSGMVKQSMIGIPVESIQSKNGKVVSGYKTSFSLFNGDMYLPTAYSAFNTDSGTYETQLTIDRYDTRGNILQYREKDHIPTSFLWSYNGKYPVFEIKNATWSQVVDALGPALVDAVSDYDGSILSPVPDFQAIGTLLRNKLHDALVSAYTYNPLVGVKGISDPAGRTIHYSYDPFNRLSEIRDDQGINGNLLQRFEYKVKNNF